MFILKDIPVFTTIYGAASLILYQIPFTRTAYIRLQSTQSPEEFLAECVDFCVMAGAESVYATGDVWLERFPVATSIISMSCDDLLYPETDAYAMSVQEKDLTNFKQIYNAAMAKIPNAECISTNKLLQILRAGNCYYVFKDNRKIGIGIAEGDCLESIIAIEPGMGQDVLAALYCVMKKDLIRIEVASANERAVRFFTKNGFKQNGVISNWYKVF